MLLEAGIDDRSIWRRIPVGYFKMVNERGGINGRKIKLVVEALYQTLVPGDIGYLCNGCGQSLQGGFLGINGNPPLLP